jgi:hypothetical protein
MEQGLTLRLLLLLLLLLFLLDGAVPAASFTVAAAWRRRPA